MESENDISSTDREVGPREVAAQEAFARLFVQHQRMLLGYLVNLLGNLSDAEEVLQETSVVLWRNWRQFTPGSNFAAWACRTAENQVHRFRRQQQRCGSPLDDELLDRIAAEGLQRWQEGEPRLAALEGCLAKLPAADRQLVAAIYGRTGTMIEAAETLERPLNSVYKGIQRVRRKLLECIERTLRAEDRS